MDELEYIVNDKDDKDDNDDDYDDVDEIERDKKNQQPAQTNWILNGTWEMKLTCLKFSA